MKRVAEVLKNKRKQDEYIEQQIDSIVIRCLASIKALSAGLERFQDYTESADIRAKIKSHMRRRYYPFKQSTLAKLRVSLQDVRDDLVPALGILRLEKLNGLEEETKNLTVSLASMQKGSSNLNLWPADVPLI